MGTFRFHNSGIDGIHPDFPWPQFLRQRARHGVHRTLGRGINGRMWRRHRARNRTDVNHAAAIGTEVLSGFLRRQNESEDVRAEHAVKLLLGNLLEGSKLVDARIVHEHVQTSKGFLGFGEDALHVFGLCYISLHRDGFATLGFNFRNNPLRPFFAGGVIDDYGCTFCRQTPGDARSDALGRAGYYRHLVRKLTHDFSPFDLPFVRHFDDHLIDDGRTEKIQIAQKG